LGVVDGELIFVDEFEVELETVLDQGGHQDQLLLTVILGQQHLQSQLDELALLDEAHQFIGYIFDAFFTLYLAALYELLHQRVEGLSAVRFHN
jgi:hypothetical protein